MTHNQTPATDRSVLLASLVVETGRGESPFGRSDLPAFQCNATDGTGR